MLLDAGEEYLSGSRIAETLGISRAAVWKQIRALEDEGYQIEAVQNRGYRLAQTNDVLSKDLVLRYLDGEIEGALLDVRDEVTSTNTLLKEAAERLPAWSVVCAGAQTAGRGRSGRSFYSPKDTGLYLSVLLKPEIPAAQAGRITTAAAVAACRAIEACTEAEPKIKWVK